MSGTEALLILGTAVSAIGAIQGGVAAQKDANNNAQGLFQTAHADRITALEKMKRQKRANAQIQGANRSHNPDKLDLLEDNAREQKLAELDILHAGEVSARGHENTARLQIAKGKSAMASGVFGAFSSVLMGAATYGMMPGGGGGLTTAQQTSIINAPSGGFGSPITIGR
jgi:hypothetical protein|tara:strand:- start:55 stop:564 length:510 start_codon:yes stop_codon:yes gene_type:complete